MIFNCAYMGTKAIPPGERIRSRCSDWKRPRPSPTRFLFFTFFNFFGSDGTTNSSFRLPTRTATMMRKMPSSPCRRRLLLLLLSKPSLRQTTLIQRAGNSHSNGFRFYSQLAPQRRPGENERSRGLLLSSVDYHIISCSFFRAPSFSIDLV